MKTPLISIIIPCYKQSQYLSKALDSLQKQTYPFWECIIVNDGSPDNTEEVALGYCEINEQFIYVYKENGGVSTARNLGLMNVKGEYVTFIDADDWVDPDYLQNFVDVDNLSSKFVLQGAYREHANGTNEICNEDFYLAGGCGNLFQRQVIVDHNLLFDVSLKLGEDTMFNLTYIRYVNKFLFLSKYGYHYRERASIKRPVSIESLLLFYQSLEIIGNEKYILDDIVLHSFVSNHKGELIKEISEKIVEDREKADSLFTKNNPALLKPLLFVFDYQNQEIKNLENELHRIHLSYAYGFGKLLLTPFSYMRHKILGR